MDGLMHHWGQHSGAVLSIDVLQRVDSGFKPVGWPGPFCTDFACSLHACMGFLLVLQFPSTVKGQLATPNFPKCECGCE